MTLASIDIVLIVITVCSCSPSAFCCGGRLPGSADFFMAGRSMPA
jgi:hypothetical protein